MFLGVFDFTGEGGTEFYFFSLSIIRFFSFLDL